MIFDIPPFCPYEVIKGEIEYMGWASFQDKNTNEKTDHICTKMAMNFPLKTFLRIMIGTNKEFAIRHNCVKEGDIFRVFGDFLYFWDINCHRHKLLTSMRFLGLRFTPFPNPINKNVRKPRRRRIIIVNGVKMITWSKNVQNNSFTDLSSNKIPVEKSYKDKLKKIEPEFQNLSINHISSETENQEKQITEDIKYTDFYTRTTSRYLPYITEINKERTLLSSKILSNNSKFLFGQMENTGVKTESISDENQTNSRQ